MRPVGLAASALEEMLAVARRQVDEAHHQRQVGGAELRVPGGRTEHLGAAAQIALDQRRHVARRTAQALHPTTLHVNVSLHPRDTVQSRLPDPGWLEAWLDRQIRFDDAGDRKVVERILHNASVQQLNRYRKELAAPALAC